MISRSGHVFFGYIKVKSIPGFILMKLRSITPLIILSLFLFACAAVNSVPPVSPEPPTTTPGISITTTVDISPTYEGCAFVEASQNLPDLSAKVVTLLQGVDPALTGSAYAYGENCLYADGHSTFSARETEFRVKVPVTDLKDEKSLGDWIARVMDVITRISPDELSGPQPGRVEFEFSKSESETLFLNVSISKYKSQASGLSGSELFKLFSNNP
jgi:hypothetical protein